jgi:predicted tellurium resistance membrane protein TerC
MQRLHTSDQFKTPAAGIVMGIIGLVLAYLLLSRAFDTASWWQYLGTLLLLVLSVRLISKAIKHNR